ncbi:hypothetical protein ABKN59_002714 [Abortiporus biennis]
MQEPADHIRLPMIIIAAAGYAASEQWVSVTVPLEFCQLCPSAESTRNAYWSTFVTLQVAEESMDGSIHKSEEEEPS